MAAVDGFAIALGRLSGAIDANWERAADVGDPEGLHDLRVALRRTRAVVHAGRKVLPRPLVVEATDRLRDLTAATGPARDLDVLVDDLDADLGPWRAAVDADRTAARAQLEAALDGPEVTAWRRAWPGAIADLSTHPGRHAARRLARVVARRLEQGHDDVLAAGRELGSGTADEALHALRKDARRLRDLLECFAELAPGPAKRFIRHLKAFQGVLGRHQDLVVQLDVLGRLSSSAAAVPVVERLTAERDERRAEFAERFAAYDTQGVHDSFDELLARVKGRGA